MCEILKINIINVLYNANSHMNKIFQQPYTLLTAKKTAEQSIVLDK